MTQLTDNEFNAELDKAVEVVKRFVADVPVTTLPPSMTVIVWDAFTAAKQKMPIVLAEFSGERKYDVLHAVGFRLAREGLDVLAVFLTSEVWLRKPKMTADGATYGRIKGEAVSVAGATHDGRRNLCLLPIRRGRNRRIILEAARASVMRHEAGSRSRVGGVLLAAFWHGYQRGRVRRRPGSGRPPSGN